VRKLFVKFFVPFLAVTSLSGFLVGLSAFTAAPSGAAVSQVGGSDVPILGVGWTWTYTEVFALNDPGTGFFDITENVTYKVADVEQHTNYSCPASFTGGICNPTTAPGVAVATGTYETYRETFSGAATTGTGSASLDGTSYTLTGIGSSSGVTGTQWVQVSNLASVETDQTQTINGNVSIIVSVPVTINFQNNDVYIPPQVNQDFRLHSGDTWLENTDVYDNGTVSFSAAGNNGTDAIDTYGPISATATDTSTGTGIDSINYNDTADSTSDTRVWNNADRNISSDVFLTGIPQGQTCTSAQTASCEETTMNLTGMSFPTPPTSLTEGITGPSAATGLACGGQVVTVSGVLSSGFVTTNTSTTSGGAYTANVTAPNLVDGQNKPGVNGSFGVVVNAGGVASSATLEVSPQDCTTTTYSGATTGAVGSNASVSATVTDVATGHPVTGAVVTFALAGQSGSVTGSAAGSNGVSTASLPLTDAPSATPYVLTSTYAGGPSDAASSTTSNFTVTQDPTGTSITPSEVSATIGDTPTFTAQVTKTGATSGALTGTVTFTVNGSPLGTPVTISGTGSATSVPLNTLSLGLGTYNVVATYNGNVDYATSSGNIPAFDVHPPLTATTTALAINPVSGTTVFGQTVTLTATVAPQVDNTNNAVTFLDGTTVLGVANLSGTSPDTATLTVSTLAVGTHSLTAAYGGDGDTKFAPSTSNPVALTVAIAPSTTAVTLVTPATTPVSFQGVTFGVTVSPPAGETAMPTGTVQVAVDGVNLGGPLTLTGGTATVSKAAGLTAGSHTVTATYSGDSGFSGSSGSLTQTVSQASTTTALVSSTGATGSVVNQVVTFTANVTPQEAGNPSGTVTFFSCPTAAPCSNQIGQSTLSATGAAGSQATLQLSNLPEGDNFITVTYGGDGNFTGSSSAPPFDQVVSPPPPTAATSTTVSGATSPASSSPNTSVFGQSVTFTATVSVDGLQDAVNAAAGTVQFSIDGTNLGGPVPLTAVSGSQTSGWTSTAQSPAISSLVAGGHSVIATYSGLSGAGIPQAFEGSGAIVTQDVQQATTTVTGAPSANPAAFGQTETFSATIKAVAPGAGVPGGSVQFSLNGAAFGTPATVSGGTATSGPATGLLPGTYTVSFVTSGDANFLSSSGSFTFLVQKIPTATGLTANPNPVIFGQPLTLVATVTHSTGPGTPSGSITFKDGSTVLTTQTLSPSSGGAASASFTTSALAAGVHSLTASYSGDPNFAVSVSGPVSVTVGGAATVVTARAAILTYNLANLLTPNGVLSLGALFATLTTANGTPIAGQTLVFSAVASPGGPVVCSGVTNAQGVATCTPTLAGSLQVDLSGGFTATFAATPAYKGSNGSAGLIQITL
jgi:hypothetical protein